MDPEYPSGFPPVCQNRVEGAMLRAAQDNDLTQDIQKLPLKELAERALRWICSVLDVFAQQACELGEAKRWTIMQIRKAVEEFRLELVRAAHFKMSDGRLGWVDHVFGIYICEEVRRAIEISVEWRRYQDRLLALADGQVGSPTLVAPQSRKRPKEQWLRAKRRQAVVNPLLREKRWTRGRLVTNAGVGKATVYEYLNGKRTKISKPNRQAIADCLGLKVELLPP